jgi:hypothetical protein
MIMRWRGWRPSVEPHRQLYRPAAAPGGSRTGWRLRGAAAARGGGCAGRRLRGVAAARGGGCAGWRLQLAVGGCVCRLVAALLAGAGMR